jgi:hypothetical protein
MIRASSFGRERMKFRAWAIAASITAIALTGACKQADGGADAAAVVAADKSAWGSYMAGFLDSYFKVNPTNGVLQGRHEFDGQLPDWSAEGLKAQMDQRKKAIADAKNSNAIT